MKSSMESRWIAFDCRVNGLQFHKAKLRPMSPNPRDFEVVIEHQLLGRFGLHDDFVLELRGSTTESEGWRKVSLERLKDALLRTVELSKETEAFDGTTRVNALADWELEDPTAEQVRLLPRIPIDADTDHIGLAVDVLTEAGIQSQIIGGIGSRGKIWGHVTLLVASPLEAKASLLRAGFVPSPDSDAVLINSKNGWKIRLLAGRT